MRFDNVRIGFAMTGSFCTFSHAFAQMEALLRETKSMLEETDV